MFTDKGYKRAERVSRSIQRVLSDVLSTQTSDPALRGVHITDVRLTDDLKSARIHWYFTKETDDEKRTEEVSRAFKRAQKRFRKLLGVNLRTKNTPKLTFVYDKGIDAARRIEELLTAAETPSTESE